MDVAGQFVKYVYGANAMTKKNSKSSPKVVYDSNVCKRCGTKVFLMIGKNKYKCVLCRAVKTEKK
jgi:ribosomal protein S27AE